MQLDDGGNGGICNVVLRNRYHPILKNYHHNLINTILSPIWWNFDEIRCSTEFYFELRLVISYYSMAHF